MVSKIKSAADRLPTSHNHTSEHPDLCYAGSRPAKSVVFYLVTINNDDVPPSPGNMTSQASSLPQVPETKMTLIPSIRWGPFQSPPHYTLSNGTSALDFTQPGLFTGVRDERSDTARCSILIPGLIWGRTPILTRSSITPLPTRS